VASGHRVQEGRGRPRKQSSLYVPLKPIRRRQPSEPDDDTEEADEGESVSEVEAFFGGLAVQDERYFLSLVINQMMRRRGQQGRLALTRHIVTICNAAIVESRRGGSPN
jgi:hypothetical protein